MEEITLFLLIMCIAIYTILAARTLYKVISKPKARCKHYVKNWNAKRGTYLCSGCGNDFTNSLTT